MANMKWFSKNKQGILSLFILIILLIIASCTEDIPLNDLNFNDQVVVNSFISPGKNIELFLNYSENILNDSFKIIKDPGIMLYENGELLTISHNYDGQKYIIPYSVKSGYEYTCVIMIPGNNQSIIMKDTVPELPGKISASIKYHVLTDEFGSFIDRLNLHIQDQVNRDNFYEIALTNHSFRLLNYMTVNSPVITVDTETGYMASPVLLFSDELFKDDELNLTIYTQSSETPMVIFRNVSCEYFKYKKALYPHIYTQNRDRENVFEFFKGDPADLYSNVEKGLGIFAAYTETIIKSVEELN